MLAKLFDGTDECLCYPAKEIFIPFRSGDNVLAIGAGVKIRMNKKLHDVSVNPFVQRN